MPDEKPTFDPFVELQIDADGAERVPPEIVHELDRVFSDVPNVDTVGLASLLLKLAGRVKNNL